MKFGKIYKDLITGFEGALVDNIKHITGCDNCKIVDNKGEDKWIKKALLKEVSDGNYLEIEQSKDCNKIEDIEEASFNFRDEIKDEITGYSGKVIAISLGVCGDISYCISQKYDRNARENDGQWFDEGRLKLIKKCKGEEAEDKEDKKRVGGIADRGLKLR